MKYKKGQLVEVIESLNGNKGKRFIVGRINVSCHSWSDEGVTDKVGYYSGIFNGKNREFIAPESFIKLVNPDNDEQSDLTFEQLISYLKRTKLLTHNTK